MPKQPVNINFAQGVNTKVDPWQIPIGQFYNLENSVFDVGGQLKKRNGYQQLPDLPSSNYSFLTTLKDNLTAVGYDIAALNQGSKEWTIRGNIQPLSLNVLPLVRNSINQIQCDSAIADNGFICTVYSEKNGSSFDYKYVIANSVTGQNIIEPTLIPVTTGTVTGSPRVFILGKYFVIVFTNVISATSHLQYISVATRDPNVVTVNQDIASSYISATTVSWDAYSFNNNLYIAYNTTSGGQSVNITILTMAAASQGNPPNPAVVLAGAIATMVSISIDTTTGNPSVYLSYYDLASQNGFTVIFDLSLALLQAPTAIITATIVLNIATAAKDGVCSIYYEVSNNYSYDSAIPTHFIDLVTLTGAIVSSPVTVIRSLGLASKAFIINDIIYFLGAYQSQFQNSYFMINGDSRQESPIIAAKLAWENGGGYLTLGLPSVNVNGNSAQISYLFKDLIEPISTMNNTQQTTTGGVYAQTGINLATFDFGLQNITSVEIANGLQLGGGFGWLYDGYLPVEQNFFLFPDNVEVTTSGSGGSITAQQYYYQALYEWSDNQGNINRSPASIPFTITTTGSTSSNTIHVPTIRLTYKIANPAKIVIYRWSTAQQVYYQVTSVSTALLNSTTVDSVTFVDTQSDAQILGNSIIYTTGGVVEDINPPSSSVMTLFDTRAWLVDAEDPNLLWFSKQVIEATPVEWSDLFTLYIAPNAGIISAGGPTTALFPMDDKLIIFKGQGNVMYYLNGIGPDNTGNPSPSYNGPVFITSTVSCSNPNSIVLIPQGLMFQSSKGIWLLGRDGMSTSYIGAPVERFNSSVVQSAVSIPNHNQVRFTLNTGETLIYDYFFEQWGVFTGVPAVSSCIYQNLHSFINKYGKVYQESPGSYVDGANPVLMAFTTGWINLAALQGFERFYYFYFAGRYLSPHKLNVQLSYNYVSSAVQNILITPNNFSSSVPSPFGDQPAPFGSPRDFEQWKVHAKRQKCQSFQITVNEIFDPSLGVMPGAGLTLSGLNMVVLIKRGTRPIPAIDTAG